MLLEGLKTERRNRASAGLDRLSALEIATLMNHEDEKVTSAIRKVLPAIGRAIELVRERLEEGGRLIYVGSGTSGRIGALDSSECPLTFGTDPEMIQYVISGGGQALASADEAGEDSAELGANDMAARNPGKKDVVVGLAASGRTPYTIAAMTLARDRGSSTIAVVCNTDTEMAGIADIAIEAVVGPEVLTGSTRLKAGSAQKQICNMLTTGALARLGYVYGNLMVNVRLKNAKLVERGISIIQEIANVDRTVAEKTLEITDMDVPMALVMLCAKVDKAEAEQRLKRAKNRIREAIAA
jgi:N-acetylmuramic acid 6-phosphate etherase